MEAIAILLLPMAIVIASYALGIYFTRLRQEYSDEVFPCPPTYSPTHIPTHPLNGLVN